MEPDCCCCFCFCCSFLCFLLGGALSWLHFPIYHIRKVRSPNQTKPNRTELIKPGQVKTTPPRVLLEYLCRLVSTIASKLLFEKEKWVQFVCSVLIRHSGTNTDTLASWQAGCQPGSPSARQAGEPKVIVWWDKVTKEFVMPGTSFNTLHIIADVFDNGICPGPTRN